MGQDQSKSKNLAESRYKIDRPKKVRRRGESTTVAGGMSSAVGASLNGTQTKAEEVRERASLPAMGNDCDTLR